MSSRWQRRIIAGLLGVAFGLVGCDRSDRGGEAVVTAGVAPERIIAIAPSVTEMLFVLGLGDRVVGVGDYAQWPPEVHTLPRLGGLFNARLEAIAALQPDLAVLLPSEERLIADLEKMDIEVLVVRSDTLEDVEEMALRIGERCGVEETAAAFVDEFRRDLAPKQRADSPAVLLSVTRQPGRLSDILVAGPDTFLNELLNRLGALNVMFDAPLSYPQVGLEEILIRQPDVVIELQATPGNSEALRRDWVELSDQPSLSGLCVRVVSGDHVLLPGPRVPRLYRELDEALDQCQAES